MTAQFNARLAGHRLTTMQWAVLDCLWAQDGLTQQEISQRRGIDAATLTEMLKRMAARGLVRRERDPDNNRYQRVYLTAEDPTLRDTIAAVALTTNHRAPRASPPPSATRSSACSDARSPTSTTRFPKPEIRHDPRRIAPAPPDRATQPSPAARRRHRLRSRRSPAGCSRCRAGSGTPRPLWPFTITVSGLATSPSTRPWPPQPDCHSPACLSSSRRTHPQDAEPPWRRRSGCRARHRREISGDGGN